MIAWIYTKTAIGVVKCWCIPSHQPLKSWARDDTDIVSVNM